MRRAARLLPSSLSGQLLLALALALLAAQSINAVFLYRAQHDRAQSAILSVAAFRLSAASQSPLPLPLTLPPPRDDMRQRGPDGDDRTTTRRGRNRQIRRADSGVIAMQQSPQRAGEVRQLDLESDLAIMLANNGIVARDVLVLRRGEDDPETRRWLDRRADQIKRKAPHAAHRRPKSAVIAAIAVERDGGTKQWLVTRVGVPEMQRRVMLSLLAQTLIIFIILFAALAWLMRRITRPLAMLTDRVQRFGEARQMAPPMPVSGPADVARLIHAQHDMEARIHALLDEKDVMLGAIGHDLKTPLSALRVRIETVADDVERQRMAATIEDINRTLDDILSLARVGHPTDALENTDLVALTSMIAEEFEDLGSPVTLEAPVAIAMPVRATWLRRALRNLATNALRYGSNSQPPRMLLERAGAHGARWTISDDGPGIPDDQIEAMMQPFARLEKSRNSGTGGAGLGLTLARAIAQQQGGSRTVRNRRDADGRIAGLDAVLLIPG